MRHDRASSARASPHHNDTNPNSCVPDLGLLQSSSSLSHYSGCRSRCPDQLSSRLSLSRCPSSRSPAVRAFALPLSELSLPLSSLLLSRCKACRCLTVRPVALPLSGLSLPHCPGCLYPAVRLVGRPPTFLALDIPLYSSRSPAVRLSFSLSRCPTLGPPPPVYRLLSIRHQCGSDYAHRLDADRIPSFKTELWFVSTLN